MTYGEMDEFEINLIVQCKNKIESINFTSGR